MFKAKHKSTGEEIVILDEQWNDQLNYLRSLARNNEIICPGCIQPVRVRAGRKRRRHFAHKHLQNCPYGYESPTLLNARAVLYDWLVDRFGEGVEIEKQIDSVALPRHVDCWVESEQGDFAYWIIEAGMKPKNRDSIKESFEKLEAQVHWVFVSEILREDEKRLNCIHLTTTEREFMGDSMFNEMKFESGLAKAKSLHYLDADTQTFTTYRKLHLVHAPQLYQGEKLSHPLSAVRVSYENGEFVHPGEEDALARLKIEKVRLEKEVQDQSKTLSEARRKLELSKEDVVVNAHLSPPGANDPSQFNQLEAVCIHCGQITTNYWYLNRKNNTCKCRECAELGKH